MVGRIALFACISLGITGLSAAQQPGPLTRAVQTVSVQQDGKLPPKPEGFAEWQRELAKAQSDRRRARNYILLGIGAGIGGTILATTAAHAEIGDCVFRGDCGRGPAYALGWTAMLAGYGFSGYGGWKYVSAKDRIDDLDREGRTKGYLSWVPGPRGRLEAGVRVTF